MPHPPHIALAFTIAGMTLLAVAGAEPVDFRTQVLPLLSENCFHCHGPDAATRKGGLRLDRRDDALRPAESGEPAIVPGKPDASPLIHRLVSHDPDEVMPPPETKKSLSPDAVRTLRDWIEQGAEYRGHWAFEPLKKPPVPPHPSSRWPRNPIDAFILASLSKHHLEPSPEASKATLLRRLSLDLIGLPPTPAELQAFVSDNSPGAYDAAVDRLLASPHYGERMALPWLDAARFADSNGFQQDGDTYQYVWRDWVVRALNANMPFDQFTIEQLAGDLLPNATIDQKIASAINRNHLLNGEGGAIPEEQRNVILFDRVDVTSTTWLGLTMACAQCHDHKYDPIPQRDFYRMMAFFNHVPETGMPPGGGQYRIAEPWIHAGTPAELDELAGLKKKADDTAKPTPQVIAARDSWERIMNNREPVEWSPIRPHSATADHGVVLEVSADHHVVASGPAPDRGNYHLEFSALPDAVTGIRIELIPDPRLPKGGSGRADSGNAVLTRLRITTPEGEVPLALAAADYAQDGFQPEGVLDDDPSRGWAFHPDVASPHALTLQPSSAIAAGKSIRLTLEFQSKHVRHQFGHFRVSITSAPQPVARQKLPAALAKSMEKPAAKRNIKELKEGMDYFLATTVDPLVTTWKHERDSAAAAYKSAQDALPRVMIMSDGKPRKTHVYSRGVYTVPLEEVQPGTPECLPPMATDLPNNRLGLAKWLMNPENPLPARVQVNRYWQLFFGRGLVKSSENLGVQADAPSHPELLDWLAAEFRDSGWNVKQLHKRIVTSATYRQTANSTSSLLEIDPENRLLARSPRFRMSSLILRDAALASSGLLNPAMGGKPVYPYQPAGIWDGLSVTKERDFTYPQSTGNDLHRRSIYTFWRRTVAPGNMFDASSRNLCSVKPSLTNTPIHALITLNDVTWNEAARALAIQVIRGGAADDTQGQIRNAWIRVCSREPREDEVAILMRSFKTALEEFTADPDAAHRYLSHGHAMRELPAGVTRPYLAALSAVCLSIFNLDEALTRG